ncbi:WD40 repeat domain-containing protein [Nonomuraea sp. NPDC049158]|uniref:WD40 repeat domain-containing protein n=1 Tax=Nonomuraea sp. NPDC049158 TaxID=3155649 RepID=UPI0033C74152
MPLDLTSLTKAGPAPPHGALGGAWPPALLRAYRRALPRLRALPGPERLEYLRATAAAEEPEALAALDAAEPRRTWILAWETGEQPTAFHVCPARHDGPVWAVAVGEYEGRTFVASGGDDHVVRLRAVSDPSGPDSEGRSGQSAPHLEGHPDQSDANPPNRPDQSDADLEGHAASVRALAFGAVDGRPVLAGGDHGGTIRTWNPLTGASGFTRDLTGGYPTALAFVEAEGGRTLLAVAVGFHNRGYPEDDEDGRVDLLDPATGELVRELRAEERDAVLDLGVAKLGERTVLASLSPYELHVWDVATGERLGTAELDDVWPDMEQDGLTPPLLMGEWNGRPEVGVVARIEHPPDYTAQSRELVYLKLDNLRDRSRSRGFDRDQGPVAMTTHAGRNVMLVANHTDTGKEWERPAKAVITRPGHGTDIDLDADTRLITTAAFGSLAGRLCLATGGLDGTVQVWDAQTPHQHRRTGYGGSGLALVSTAQGAPALAVGTHSDTVLVVDAANGEKIGSVGCRQSGRNHDCDISPYDHCCRGLAAGNVAGRPSIASSGCAAYGTMLWQPLSKIRGIARKDDAEGGRVTFGGLDHSSPTALAFGEVDGRALLAAGAEVWDPVTHECVAKLSRWGFALSESAFGRADDQPVLATRRDNEVDLWNPLTGRHIRTLGVDDAGAGLAMGRIADHDVLAVGSGRYVHLWDTTAGERREWVPHTSTVTCLSLVGHDDRLLLVTGTEDGTMTLWDAAAPRHRVAVLGAFARPVRSVAAATIHGRLYVYGQSRYGRVLAWRVDAL